MEFKFKFKSIIWQQEILLVEWTKTTTLSYANYCCTCWVIH